MANGVERVLAVGPEPYLREQATAAATHAQLEIQVMAGDAEHVPAPDGSVDAVADRYRFEGRDSARRR